MNKIILIVIGTLIYLGANSQVAINTTGASPTVSAMLDVTSTTKGILVPRMTTIQRNAISSPVTGLMVFDNTTGGFWFYTGSAWTDLSSGIPDEIADTDGDTKIQVEESNNDDMIRFDLGGNACFRMQNDATTGYNAKFIIQNNGYSIFMGQEAGPSTAQGAYYNSFIGYKSGQDNTTGRYNTGIGAFSLNNNTTGWRNTGLGASTMGANTTGMNNTAVGNNTLSLNTSGSSNSAVGYQALTLTTTGSNNTAIGRDAAAYNSTAYSNVAVGVSALFKNETKSNLVAIGDSALFNNETGASSSTHGIYNTAVGSKVLFSNTTGSGNSSFGFQSMYFNTTGTFNTASGQYALKSNTTGSYNTAGGLSALGDNDEGSYNTAFGAVALDKNINGNHNVAIGLNALLNNTSGNFNVALGSNADLFNQTGSNNTVLGYKAGQNSQKHSKSGNIFLGYQSGFNEAGSNKLYIENSDADSASALIYGEFDNNYLAFNGKIYVKDSLKIGTNISATGYLLSVGGKIACEEVRVALEADWPDYVFASDYQLISIEEMSLFIDKNGHLPNIPSADEIENSGLEMGEMQRKMMEKIEELSLYVIDLQKQIKEINSEKR